MILYDGETGYLQRLAAQFKRCFFPGVSIAVFGVREDAAAYMESVDKGILLTGDLDIIELKMRYKNIKFCCLEPQIYYDEPEEDPWDLHIFKYQSVNVLAELLRKHFCVQIPSGIRNTAQEQEWYGVCSPCRHEMLLSYSGALAQTLASQKKVLWVSLSGFSGMDQVLEEQSQTDLESLILALRKTTDQKPALDSYLVSAGKISVLVPPRNPMALCECQARDLEHLAVYLRESTAVEAVVWMFDCLHPGSVEIFRNCRKIYCLEKEDTSSRNRQQQFYQFMERIFRDRISSLFESVNLPVTDWSETGIHLLWQWEQSGLGADVRRRLQKLKADRS